MKQQQAEYPLATVAYYGPDDQRATKVAVNIFLTEIGESDHLRRWFSGGSDIRYDELIQSEILDYFQKYKVKSVVTPDRIIGCPHEEGYDYPEGENCPECPYWANRDRWTGEIINS